ncbi:unnamed protein product [Sphagnum troendelagicum]|uniref:Clu domain-containing protein n=1 Tax=Sphagnum jensenii TaxID=128206 RepID=A0ABP0WGJ5_9BRYO
MAPRTSRAKAHKLKGEKKKKEEKILPAAIDIVVVLPDGNEITLKGITTDRLLDIRRLLAVNVQTCHLTNYSFHHEVRGSKLQDMLEVSVLKPCVLDLVEEDYTEDLAIAHVRRLLDIVACTTSFGSSGKQAEPKSSQEPIKTLGQGAAASNPAAHMAEANGNMPPAGEDFEGRQEVSAQAIESVPRAEIDKAVIVKSEKRVFKGKPEAAAAIAAAKEATEKGDMTGMCPPSKLGQFYEFLSFSHLTPPLQFLRRSLKQTLDKKREGDFFVLDVRLCNGKLVTVTVCDKGFSSCSKQQVCDHSLVALLCRLSKAFTKAYDDLMKAFVERNKFGNLPYGFRANTWVVPPVAAEAPSTFPALPVEDETWGGDGGGKGRDMEGSMRPWARDFAILAAMPCKTPEERQIRDHKAFLHHNMFIDIAVTQATDVIQEVSEKDSQGGITPDVDDILHVDTRCNLKLTVRRDTGVASKKLVMKIDSSQAHNLSNNGLAEKNLLKGITADESTTIHDTQMLGTVIVRHRGFIAIVEAAGTSIESGEVLPTDLAVEEHPEGGANALNLNSLRTLLHKRPAGAVRPPSDAEELQSAGALVNSMLEESLTQLEQESKSSSHDCIRWELGACWVQQLQTQAVAEKEAAEGKAKEGANGPSAGSEKTSKASLVPDLNRKQDIISKDEDSDVNLKTKAEGNQTTDNSTADDEKEQKKTGEQVHLTARLPPDDFARLKETATGLHCKSIEELMEGAKNYYDDIALPKLVADFGSLELSPVDGRTLTDFMHTRGLRMRSLGRVAELAEKLPHVESLCIHEMVVRAYKHVLRAVVAASKATADLPVNIAAALNVMLGTSPDGDASLIWRWVDTFVSNRFGWKLIGKVSQTELRKYSILRGLCHKVGIEVAPRDYGLDTPTPFKKMDVISMVPVHKQVACSSADGRTLLESSKTALDKGKLDDAVTFGTKALSKLVAVCGPYHRMTAGAYSLLAVVLYHTGDFNQATIYQQKALDINERELGLDHPDTMKSYGDLAVFYYRLQHTELALKYVNRALYLLHLTCGPSHPNTAATYINVAMMEEGLGNIHIALRYLHEALKCNQRLLGADHIQTAASYHAIAIALSLMEAYSLSVQHEQTTLQILQAKLGPDDLRTQDAAAWLEYFDSKAVEQQEAARNGTPKPDASIASKGHLSVSDLLEFINDSEQKEKELEKKRKARQLKSVSSTSQPSTPADEFNKEASMFLDSDEEKSESDSVESSGTPKDSLVSPPTPPKLPTKDSAPEPLTNGSNGISKVPDHVEVLKEGHEDEGWQEAVPRGRFSGGGSRRSFHKDGMQPAGGKMNGNLLSTVKTLLQRESDSQGQAQEISESIPGTSTGAVQVKESACEKEDGGKSLSAGTPVVQTVEQVPGQPIPGISISLAAGPGPASTNRTVFSYKEVALAPPGTRTLMRPALELPAAALEHSQQDSSSPSTSSSKSGNSPVADQGSSLPLVQEEGSSAPLVTEEGSPPVPEEVEKPEPMASSDVPDSESAVNCSKSLSPAAPPFKPGVTVRPAESTAVAVTPFKDGKTPPLPSLPSQLPLPQVPTTIAVTPMRYGPYHGGYPGMYQFPPPPPPPKRSVQMNPNAEEFIPRYLQEQAASPHSPPVVAVPVSPSSEMQAVSEQELLQPVTVAEHEESIESSSCSSSSSSSSSEDEQVVDQKESSEQSSESDEGVESLPVTELEEKVETHFSQEGEAELNHPLHKLKSRMTQLQTSKDYKQAWGCRMH